MHDAKLGYGLLIGTGHAPPQQRLRSALAEDLRLTTSPNAIQGHYSCMQHGVTRLSRLISVHRFHNVFSARFVTRGVATSASQPVSAPALPLPNPSGIYLYTPVASDGSVHCSLWATDGKFTALLRVHECPSIIICVGLLVAVSTAVGRKRGLPCQLKPIVAHHGWSMEHF